MKHLFPFFSRSGLAYLDSAGTSQILGDAAHAEQTYSYVRANPHGTGQLQRRALDAYEQARADVAEHIGARPEEIVFTKGATEGLNLLANTIRSPLTAHLDPAGHSSALMPWLSWAQCETLGFDEERGELRQPTVNPCRGRINLLVVSLASNVTGAGVGKDWIEAARSRDPNCVIIADAAQAIPHKKIDVRQLDADFVVFSAHKVYGPSGIGVLWGKAKRLAELMEYQVGGGTPESVSLTDGYKLRPAPHRFEAGTPNVPGVVGLAASLKWHAENFNEIRRNEVELTLEALKRFREDFPEVRILPRGRNVAAIPVISFVAPWAHAHDIGQIMDDNGVVIRVGKHCAEPLHDLFGVDASCRISLGAYTDQDDLDRFFAALKKARDIFAEKS